MTAISPFRTAIRMSSRAAAYGHAKTGGFSQVGPVLHNPYRDDPFLIRTLERFLPSAHHHQVAEDLDRFGERVVNEIDRLGRQCELNQPSLEQHDAWGRRVDTLKVCPEWYRLKEICAEEGIIALGYDCENNNRDPQVRRLHQIAKLYLFSSSAGLVTCPMAMTDGAVKTLKALKLDKADVGREAVERLLSRDGKHAWTSGQWMTEKRGGSDVGGGCDTYAVQIEGNKYRLHGYKWFSSAIDADIALTLARVVDERGEAVDGSKGLSLFLLKIRNEDRTLNGIQMVRLKNKLGTKQLPTAELLLDGCVAERISQPGRGVADIANMLNITRIHNAVASISGMRRILSLARDYSTRREVFGQPQAKWPLHTATLARLEVQTRACTLLLFEAARLLGRTEEHNGRVEATHTEALVLRLITPVLKLFAGKLCVPAISEGIECFGGQGYIEDTGLPTLLRDAQVTPIWEGTTNVLAMDVLRVFSKKDGGGVYAAFVDHMKQLLSNCSYPLPLNRYVPFSEDTPKSKESKEAVQKAIGTLGKLLAQAGDSALGDEIRIDAVARDISFAIGRIYCGALLIQAASDAHSRPCDEIAAYRWCTEQPLVELRAEWMRNERIEEDRDLVYEGHPEYATRSKM